MNPSLIGQVKSLVKEPIGILGYGIEGRSTCRFLRKCGLHAITIFDNKNPDLLPQGFDYGGETGYLSKFPGIKTLFRSPGIRADAKEVLEFTRGGGTLISQVELFFQVVPSGRIIGVTGTLGKGTCCALIKSMLAEARISAELGGNIGTAVLDLLEPEDQKTWFILELSSFQLSTLRCSPRYAVVLKTTSEHLDWHSSQEEYWDHKANLVRFQVEGDLTVYCESSPGSRWIAGLSGGQAIAYGPDSPIKVTRENCSWEDMCLSLPELSLPGAFNLENVAAAVAIAKNTGASRDAILSAAKSFKGLEHRLEQVGTKAGVSFYNDSYATRPEATIAALDFFSDDPVGLILGGSDKNADFASLAKKIAGSLNIRAIALLGDTGSRIHRELVRWRIPESTHIQSCQDMKAALQFLISEVKRGNILLSPACASFGLFSNYKERGTVF